MSHLGTAPKWLIRYTGEQQIHPMEGESRYGEAVHGIARYVGAGGGHVPGPGVRRNRPS